MNWSAVSPSGGGVAATPPGAGAAGSGAFLQPENVSTAAVVASARRRWRGFTGWSCLGAGRRGVGGRLLGWGFGVQVHGRPSGRAAVLWLRLRRHARGQEEMHEPATRTDGAVRD